MLVVWSGLCVTSYEDQEALLVLHHRLFPVDKGGGKVKEQAVCAVDADGWMCVCVYDGHRRWSDDWSWTNEL